MKKAMMVVIVLIILVIILLFAVNNNSEQNYEENNNEEIIQEETESGLKIVNDRNESYTLYRILKGYNLYLNYLDFDITTFEGIIEESVSEEEMKNEYKKEGLKALTEILDYECQQQYYKTEEEIYNKLKKYANTDMNIDEIYLLESDTNIKKYVIKLISDEYIVIKIDTINNTFSIFTNDFFTNVEDIESLEINSNSIELKNYNRYTNETIDEQGLINEYFKTYKDSVSNNIEDSFLLVSNAYRNAKFKDVEDYKQYMENNFNQTSLVKYQKYEYENEKHYVCIDSESDYYIFIEERPFSFSVILDTYTINIPEFTEKYDKADENKKVAYNIEKVVSAINNKDYKYVYEKMDNTFKTNNFPTPEVFETNIGVMFFEKNEIEYEEYEKKGDVHIYTIILKSPSVNNETRKKQIFMKLGENYDFTFSFNLEDI